MSLDERLGAAAADLRGASTRDSRTDSMLGDLKQIHTRRRTLSGVTLVLALLGALTLGAIAWSAGTDRTLPSTPPTPATQTLTAACSSWQAAGLGFTEAWTAMTRVHTERITTGPASWQQDRDATGAFGVAARRSAEQLLDPAQPWPSPLAEAVPATTTFQLRLADWAAGVGGARTEAELTLLEDQTPLNEGLPADYTDATEALRQACHW